MSVKFTTASGDFSKQPELLFEFLDYELPEYIDIEYITKLGKTVFINNLQTNQIKGTYLQPIKFEAEFVGTYWSSTENKEINAKERADQLGRLQGILTRFYFDNFNHIIIIENFKMRIHNQEHVEVDMTLQPHDIILPKVFTKTQVQQKVVADLILAPLNTQALYKVDKDGLIKEVAQSDVTNATNNVQFQLNNKEKQITLDSKTIIINKRKEQTMTNLKIEEDVAKQLYQNSLKKGSKGVTQMFHNDLKQIQNKIINEKIKGTGLTQ